MQIGGGDTYLNVIPKEGLVNKAIHKGHLIKDGKARMGRKSEKSSDFETTSFMNDL